MRLLEKKRSPGMTLLGLEDAVVIVNVDHVGEQPAVTKMMRGKC